MSTINLIPPQIKAAERNRKIFSLVFSILAILVLMIAFCYGAIFALDYFAQEELGKTKEALAEEQAKIKNLEQIETKVNGINARLTKIGNYQKDRILWSKVLTDLNHSTPEQLKIDTFSAGTKDKKLTISGAGETRRDIVKLQEKLGTLGYWTNINFNSSTYSATESMYSFTMAGELKK
jgi:Tfp pilus assembly protein PilN